MSASAKQQGSLEGVVPEQNGRGIVFEESCETLHIKNKKNEVQKTSDAQTEQKWGVIGDSVVSSLAGRVSWRSASGTSVLRSEVEAATPWWQSQAGRTHRVTGMVHASHISF